MAKPDEQGPEVEPRLAGQIFDAATPATAGGLFGALVGIAVGGPAGALLGGAAGAAIPEIIKTLDAFQQRAGRSADLVVSHTSELTGLSPVDLHLWAVQDEHRLRLTAATVQAALSSLDQVKLRALARVLAEAVEDDAKLDLAALVTASLADLDPYHIRVLRALCTEPPSPNAEERAVPGPWFYSGLRRRFPNLGEGISPIMATMVRHGMADDNLLAGTMPTGEPDPAWIITDYGQSVFAHLAQVGAEGE